MSKKLILIISYIIVMIIILVFGAVSIYMYLNNQNENLNIDMNMLNTNMSEEAGFNEKRMQDITLNNVSEIFNIEQSMVKEAIGKIPLLNISSSMYVVIHTDEENVEQVKQNLNEYGINYENQWSTYMEDQYELVKQRKIGNVGNYVYMIVYEIPDDMIEHIK